jgi:N utilization substance protein B
MGIRRQGRELALQALYQAQLTGEQSLRNGRETVRHFGGTGPAQTFAVEIVDGVLDARERIDELIAQSSEHWRLGRLANVDLTILRVGTYELLHRPETPVTVIIDEAIEIAKRYGSEESAVFINGVLDQIAGLTRPGERRDAPS